MNLRFIVAGLALVLQLIHDVPPPASKAWLVSAESCPLHFVTSDQSENVLIENRSKTLVTRYSLGCVAGQPYATVGKTAHVRQGRILPGQSEISTSESLRQYRFECQSRKAAVSIVKVEFDDGGVWLLKGK